MYKYHMWLSSALFAVAGAFHLLLAPDWMGPGVAVLYWIVALFLYLFSFFE